MAARSRKTAVPRPGRRSPTADHVRINRRMWEAQSASYDRRCAPVLSGSHATSWGLWRIPEKALQILGPVRGLRVLELGCGAARWSIALRKEGALSVGLDLTRAQLRQASRLVRRSAIVLPLVQGSAETVPFRDGSFDVVFCDWGAMTFADPYRTIPECSRLLSEGGLLAFACASPIRFLAHDRRSDRTTRRFLRDYFGMHRLDFDNEVNFVLPYGKWIELMRDHDLAVESLIETQPAPRARQPYLTSQEAKWSRHWPMECIWRARKVARPSARGSTGR
jgi:ubiquinone/menaquinone biosynthesis C-methylase UbiE